MNIPQVIIDRVEQYGDRLKKSPKLKNLYTHCFLSTIKTALEEFNDGTYFVVTGDIPAMWLRDSSAQVANYVKLAHDNDVAKIIKGVLKRQFMYIKCDPYANAFNREENGLGHIDDLPKQKPIVFERKYEIDSLCYPIRLLYQYWKYSNDLEFVSSVLLPIAEIIYNTWKTEQQHFEKSPYRFIRPNYTVPWDTIHNNGMGEPVGYTGMTWSGFRPSDDGCRYGYLVASNMFACVCLGYMKEMLDASGFDDTEKYLELKAEISRGIDEFAVVNTEKYGKVYACEVDGKGNFALFDDANIPSLLSIPYIGYTNADNEIYRNTRKLILSGDNEYYYSGKFAKGIGSRHTPPNYVWHMALAMQGLTSSDSNEKLELLKMLSETDAGTGAMHEGFDVDNPYNYTREWFTWPDALFAEFVEKCVDEGLID